MQDAPQLPELKVPKWPFFLADAFMLGLAYYLFYYQTKPNVPLSQWEVIACAVCVFLAALLGIMLFQESANLVRVGCIALIVLGIVGLKLSTPA